MHRSLAPPPQQSKTGFAEDPGSLGMTPSKAPAVTLTRLVSSYHDGDGVRGDHPITAMIQSSHSL